MPWESKSDKVPKKSTQAPESPRLRNFDPEVPKGSTTPRTHVPKVWSQLDSRIAHDRTVKLFSVTLTLGFAISEYPGLRFMIRQILHDLGNT